MDIEPQMIQGRQGDTPALVDRLDPVLGEASTGIGMMLTELIRRTLRGGIQRVDEELHGVVNEKVDGAVAARLPSIEAAAVQTAQQTATAVAAREVAALDQRTAEVTARLANEIVDSHQRLQSESRELVQTVERHSEERLVHEVSVVEQKVSEKLANEVSSLETRSNERVAREIADVEQRSGEAARQLVTKEIVGLEQRSTEATHELVAREIGSVEQRSETRARELLEEEVAALKERSRLATQTLTKNVNALSEMHNALRKLLDSEKSARAESLTALGSRFQLHAEESRSHFEAELRRNAEHWKQLWAKSEESRRLLEERIAELERPRGIRAFAARLFHRKKTEQIPSVVDSILEDESAVESDHARTERGALAP